ncbi:MAG: hypothetical protein QOI90_652 [Mycobacterium sp.]|jgi:hypothetical protein|nr:hypothetical protein [Mycobacterium sp.]
MSHPDIFDRLPTDLVGMGVYGEPIHVDGATVIPVARVRGGGSATPIGVFVIRGGDVSWTAAVDQNRIALLGVITGLASAVIATLAVLRRPPWPDIVLRDDIRSVNIRRRLALAAHGNRGSGVGGAGSAR